ncbi:phosphoglycolate phosphatase [Halpernia frigidisoli]|uniref:Phosphoglycolate phosphatase n=1 Tax=Halpernia frigidisoli TaxID=1125876 RepID=A0A1I3DLJ0_9FLAO|nr:phosphoglycolate phosphatase [Halpernia frigidisoli]SFH87597.1 phosphoglycolate phosphatase [Halpernia frigidisoli]
MNFKDKELIIFDLDGTLINSIPDLTIAINKMLKHYDLAELTVEEVTPFIGNGAKTLVKRALEKAMKDKEISDAFFDKAFKYYFAAYKEEPCKETYTYPGVIETLKYLHEKGFKMVICTNKPDDFIEPILETLEIKKYFTCWIGEDSLPEKKPDPAPLLHLAKKMKVSSDKTVMIGDSKNDILAAQNAEMESIGLTYGYNYNEHIANYKPSLVVDNFADLQNIF